MLYRSVNGICWESPGMLILLVSSMEIVSELIISVQVGLNSILDVQEPVIGPILIQFWALHFLNISTW